jgi:hypothetical protein
MICGIVFMSDVIPAIMEARLFEEISQQILIANPMGWKYEEGDCWDEVSVNYSSCWEIPATNGQSQGSPGFTDPTGKVQGSKASFPCNYLGCCTRFFEVCMLNGRLKTTQTGLEQNEGCPRDAKDKRGVECVHVCDPNKIP